MVEHIEGIILKKVTYNDKLNIVYLYTHNYGFLPVIVKKSQSAKNNFSAFLMPMGIIQGNIRIKTFRDLQYLDNISSVNHLFSIRESFNKLSIVQFISEFLYQIIKYTQPDKRLYLFLKEWVLKLEEQTNIQAANMHFFVMIKLLTYFGIEPNNNFSSQKPFFNIEEACFTESSLTNNLEDENISNLWKQMLSVNYDTLLQIKISHKLRKQFIKSILNYYSYHLDIRINFTTLEVLSDVYESITLN